MNRQTDPDWFDRCALALCGAWLVAMFFAVVIGTIAESISEFFRRHK